MRGRRGRDCMVVGFITVYAISAYHDYSCEFKPRSGEVYNIMWYSLSVTYDRSVIFSGFPVSSTNKTDRHDIAEILLKAALSTINPPSYCVNQSLRKCILTNVVIKRFLFSLYYIEFKYVVHVEVPTYLCILFKWFRSYHIIHQIINV